MAEGLLKEHELAHNHKVLPFENGNYIQTIAVNKDTFITVQKVIRRDSMVIQVPAAMNNNQNQGELDEIQDFSEVRHRMEASDLVKVQYSYIENDSTGPKLAPEAKGLEAFLRLDQDIVTENKEKGYWKSNENQFDRTLTQNDVSIQKSKVEGHKSEFSPLYLLALWQYDPIDDKAHCLKEVTVKNLASPNWTNHLVHVSRQAKRIFYFQKMLDKDKLKLLESKYEHKQHDIMYVELSIDSLNVERQVAIHSDSFLSKIVKERGSQSLQVGRINLRRQELLHFTEWTDVENIDSKNPQCTMKFIELTGLSQILPNLYSFELRNADTLLQVEYDLNIIWTYGKAQRGLREAANDPADVVRSYSLRSSEKSSRRKTMGYTEHVKEIVLENSALDSFSIVDWRKKEYYYSEKKKQEPFDVEFYLGMSKYDGPTHLIIIHQKMIDHINLLKDNVFLDKKQAATIYSFKKEYGRSMQVKRLSFQDDPKEDSKDDSNYLFLAAHFADSQQFYLCSMRNRTLTQQEKEEYTFEDRPIEIHIYDVEHEEELRKLEPEQKLDQPDLMPIVNIPGFISNKSFREKPFGIQQEYILEIDEKEAQYSLKGFVVTHNLQGFSFLRTKLINNEIPQSLKFTGQTWESKFPSIMYRGCSNSGKTLYLVSTTHRKEVRIFNLQNWRFICFVEDRSPFNTRSHKGLDTHFMFMAEYQPDKSILRHSNKDQQNLYLLRISIDSFGQMKDQLARHRDAWEILGKFSNFEPSQNFCYPNIITAKLLKRKENDYEQYRVVFQMEDSSLLVNQILTKLPSKKLLLETPQSPMYSERTEINMHDQDDLDEFSKGSCTTQVKKGQLMTKLILLGRFGDAIFYLKKLESSPKISVMRMKLKSQEGQFEIIEEEIYQFLNQNICFFTRDLVNEQIYPRKGPALKDAFYILTMKKQLIYLQSGSESQHRLTGYEYQQVQNSVTQSMNFETFKSFDKTSKKEIKLKDEDSIEILHNMEQQKWPEETMMSHRTFSYCADGQSFNFSFDSKINLKFNTIEGKQDICEVQNMFGSQYLVGHFKDELKNKNSDYEIYDFSTRTFFIRPNPGNRSIDILGIHGPQPTNRHFIGDNYIMYTWKELQKNGNQKDSSYLYDTTGKLIQKVDNPSEMIDTQSRISLQLDELEVVCSSHNQLFYMVKAEKLGQAYIGITKIEGKVKTDQAQIKDLRFLDMNKLVRVGSISDFNQMKFAISNQGRIVSSEVKLDDKIPKQSLYASVEKNEVQKWDRVKINMRTNTYMELLDMETAEKWKKTLYEAPESMLRQQSNERGLFGMFQLARALAPFKHFQMDVSGHNLFIMQPDTKIFMINIEKLTAENKEIDMKWINIDLKQHRLNEKLSITCLDKDEILQIATPSSLILWDIKKDKEISVLENYEQIFDDPANFITTQYKIPVNLKDSEEQKREYILVSPNQSAVLCYSNRQKGRIYKFFCELDLYLLLHIEFQMRNHMVSRKPWQDSSIEVDRNLATIQIRRDSIFHFYYDRIELWKSLSELLTGTEDVNLDALDSMDRSKSHSKLFRRTMQLIMNKQPCHAWEAKKWKNLSAAERALMNNRFRVFEVLINLLTACEETQVSQTFLQTSDLLVRNESDGVRQYLNQKFFRNSATKKLWRIAWTLDEEEPFIFTHHTSQITQQDVEQISVKNYQIEQLKGAFDYQLDKNTKKMTFRQKLQDAFRSKLKRKVQDESKGQVTKLPQKPVDIRILDFDWISSTDKVVRFIDLLEEIEDETIFATDQVAIMVDLLWQKYQPVIRNRLFLPFVRYFFTVMILFSFFLDTTIEGNDGMVWNHKSYAFKVAHYFTSYLYLVDTSTFFLIELNQMYNLGFRKYFSQFWNAFDMISCGLNIWVFLSHLHSSQQVKTRLIATVAVCIMWLKFFYWMRLYKTTAHFVRMVIECVRDASGFLIMLLLVIGMFANANFILDQIRQNHEDPLIITEAFGIHSLDSLVRSYLLGLGSFDFANYSADQSGTGTVGLTWIFFLLATFITQILFMNMVIAIMGNTYSMREGLQDQSSRAQFVQLMNDYIHMIDIEKTFKNARYVFIVEPKNTALKKTARSTQFTRKIDSMEKKLDRKMNSGWQKLQHEMNVVQNQVHEIQANEKKFDKKIDASYELIQEMHKNMHRQNEECLREIRKISGANNDFESKVSTDQRTDLKHKERGDYK